MALKLRVQETMPSTVARYKQGRVSGFEYIPTLASCGRGEVLAMRW